MERTTIALIGLCILLILAQFFMSEGFFGSVTDIIEYCVDASGTALPCGSSGKCVDSTGNFATCSTTAVINNCMDASGTPLPCGSSGKCIDQSNAIVQCPASTGVATGVATSGGWDLGGWGMGLGGGHAPSQGPPPQQGLPVWGGQGGSYDAQFASLRNDLRNDLRRTIKNEVGKSCAGDSDDDDSSAGASPAAAQGAQFLQEVYGKDPNAYIKKDSIPCYGCSLP